MITLLKKFKMRAKVIGNKMDLVLVLCLTVLTSMSNVSVNAEALSWAKSINSDLYSFSVATTVDEWGNVYIMGDFATVADFGSGVANLITMSNANNVFIAKYDAIGNCLWARSIEGILNYGGDIAVDKFGSIYITGGFEDKVWINAQPVLESLGGEDIFLMKYDSSGNYIWAKSMGSPMTNGGESGAGVAVDKFGYIYITGNFEGIADFDPGINVANLTSVNGSIDCFIAKYDSSGNYVWAKSIGGNYPDNGGHITVNDNGISICVVGIFRDTVDFSMGLGKANLISSGKADIFIAKYDSSGKYIWAGSIGSADDDRCPDMVVDDSDNIYFTGYFSDTTDFDIGSSVTNLTSIGGHDIFIAKYDTRGNFLWAKSIGSLGDDRGLGVAIDESGNLYVTGTFQDTVDFDPGPQIATLNSMGKSNDVFVAKYDTRGNYVWAGSMGGNGYDNGSNIAIDKIGNLYITGQFEGTADFDPGPGLTNLSTTGSWNFDAFILKLACNDTTSSHLTASTCDKSYTLNGVTYTSSGTYQQIFPNTTGCDSTVTLNLTLLPDIKPIINVDGFILGVVGTYSAYQWIKDNMPIPGATGSTYMVMANGNYRVAVTNSKGCSDTSDIYPVTNYTGINDVHLQAKSIKVYPNPTNNELYIQSPVLINVMLTDVAGRMIREIKNAHSISVKDLDAGIYLLQIRNKEGLLIKNVKVMKQ